MSWPQKPARRNRREYELLFALSAQMGSGFSGTFRSAQAAIQATQKEIQELKSAQADISAYQKQQAAAEATRKRLELLQTQYDNIQHPARNPGDGRLFFLPGEPPCRQGRPD